MDTATATRLPDPGVLYRALLDRDPAWDGRAFVGVRTTGIFCRLSCPARKPKPENCEFFADAAAPLAAGYRPCKRCHPQAVTDTLSPLVTALRDAVERDPERRWSERDLEAMGHDPSTVRRAFRRHLGMTFLKYARARRLGAAATELGAGGRVIDAQAGAGYASGSGFRDAFVRVFGEVPARARGRGCLAADWIDTPLGLMLAVADDTALYLLEFNDRRALPGELKRLAERTGRVIGTGETAVTKRLRGELADYFAGRGAAFETPLAQSGSAFEQAVWDELVNIPPGTTRSYGELARNLGRPAAARAVARANGKNQLAILVPCHRVIGAGGDLTGYGGKLWRKAWLLDHERRCGDSLLIRK